MLNKKGFGIIGNSSGPRFGDFAHDCVRMQRLVPSKSSKLVPEICPMILTLSDFFFFLKMYSGGKGKGNSAKFQFPIYNVVMAVF